LNAPCPNPNRFWVKCAHLFLLNTDYVNMFPKWVRVRAGSIIVESAIYTIPENVLKSSWRALKHLLCAHLGKI